ncbi:hypothetical protein M0804_012751 [Polistes exclamans]|nr:hypothetical protein M0804_012751 [Polistes exclamans]
MVEPTAEYTQSNESRLKQFEVPVLRVTWIGGTTAPSSSPSPSPSPPPSPPAAPPPPAAHPIDTLGAPASPRQKRQGAACPASR